LIDTKIIFPFGKWILQTSSLILFFLFFVSCGRSQYKMPDSTPGLLTPVTTSTAQQTKIPVSSPLLVQLSPTAIAFDLSGTFLFSDMDGIVIADIKSKSQALLTTTKSIYAQPTETKNGYIYYLSDEGASQGMLDVYRIKPGQKIPDRITYDQYYDFYLTSCYSQDIVAYVSDQHEMNGTYNIFISGSNNSTKPKKVFSETQSITGLRCSPNGKFLAFFISNSYGISGNLYMINIDGTHLSQLTRDDNISTYSLSWSPDNQHIGVAIKAESGDKLAVVNVFDKTATELKKADAGFRIKAPVWSPDGKKILFEIFNRQETKLEVINFDGSNEKALVNSVQDGGFFTYSAVWSSSSEYIAYQIKNADKTVILYALELESGIQKNLFTENDNLITSLSWIPLDH